MGLILFMFYIALKRLTVLDMSISAPLVSENPGVSQIKIFSSILLPKSLRFIVEQHIILVSEFDE